MIGLPLALLYSNAWEWVIHKYVLHGMGKSRESFWSFHWHGQRSGKGRREGLAAAGDERARRSGTVAAEVDRE
ncbi:MAG: hypothetical protein IPN17_13835 [Deltaproteobacteria bacterium]|nr:hypothetical protein [Deltaproteobacteria bacterium]